MTVEPPHDDDFSIEQNGVQPRKDKHLRADLWQIIGGSLDDADKWIVKHGRTAAEEKIRARWLK